MAKSLNITLSNRSIGSVSISNRAIGSVTLVDVVGETGFDADAQTFFNAGTFNDALKTAYNTFFLNLKTGLSNGTNVFADQIALWILTSGNAADNAINAKNPGTFDLTFVNSPTHASTGVTFNGTTQYARTGVIPSTHLTQYDASAGVWKSSDEAAVVGILGSYNSNDQRIGLTEINPSWNFAAYRNASWASQTGTAQGLLLGTTRAVNDRELYKDGASVATNTTVDTGSQPNVELYLGAINISGSPSSFSGDTYRIGMIGNGLSDAQVADFDAAVDQLFTDLGI